MAQKIASKYAEIYISDQLGAKDELIARARSALAEELEKVRKRSVDAELALQKFRADNALTDVRLVTNLRQLEFEASSLKSQYQQVLQHYQASLQNQSLALTEARVISEAPLPGSPSFPSNSRHLGNLRRARRHDWHGLGGSSRVPRAFFPYKRPSARRTWTRNTWDDPVARGEANSPKEA